MKIAVFGAGGVGGIFGAIYAKHGHEVSFIARGEHLKAMQANGLQVKSPKGEFSINSVVATEDPTQIGPVDLVIVSVKTWQLPQAREQIAPLVGAQTLILPLLNGVDASEFLSEVYPSSQVLRGLCAVVSYVESPGVIRDVGADIFFAVGENDNKKSQRVIDLAKQLDVPEIKTNVPEDMIAAQWQKFVFISSAGAITSLSQMPSGVLKTLPKTRALLERAMKEAAQVAWALGVKLDPNAIARGMALIDRSPKEATTSMQRDFAAGRRTELESFSGYLVRQATQLGVEVPIHQTCYDLLTPLELKAQGKLI